jgi:serine/threonine protein kinase
MESLKFKPKVSFDKIFKNASKNAIDLLTSMLEFDPTKRISVEVLKFLI